MNLSQLAYLDAACRRGNLTVAAQDVCVTQQAVSLGIASLERELGLTLLDRTASGVRPTSAGKEVLADAHAVLDAAAHLRARAASLRGDMRGTVTLAYATCTIGTSGRHPCQQELAMFAQDKPDLSLRLFEAASDACLALVAQGTADIALVAGQPSLSDFCGTFLRSPELVLCVPAAHPLASRSGEISYADLQGVPQFLPPDLNYSLRATDKACRAWGFSPSYIENIPAGKSQIDCVAQGMGVAFMPDGYEIALADERVRLVHVRPDEACHIPLWLAWSAGRELAPAVEAFRAYLKGLFAQD